MKPATFLILIMALSYTWPAVSQDNDYSEYEHLWEDTKKKKKKKKNADQPKTEVQSVQQQVVMPVLAASDTIPDPSIPTDSLDLIQQVPADSLDVQEELPENLTEDLTEEEPKIRKERAPAPPMDDFRTPLPSSTRNSVNGGLTVTRIGGETYAGMVLSPEFKIWKIGVGLNVPVLFNLEDGSFRSEIFKDGVGAARLIRYLRFGNQKQDPVYVKVGDLNGTMIGFGGLVNNYTNTVSYEKRKVGLHYDINYQGFAGIEGMYSDFDPSSLNLFVLRPYVRPLSRTGIPIIQTFEIGATFLRDKDQTDLPLTDSTSTQYAFTRPGIGAFGIDAGFTVLRVPFIQIDAFLNYSRLNVESDTLTSAIGALFDTETANSFKNGSGFSFGMNFRFHFIADVMSTDIRIERLTYTDNYLPQFFDASYEINKDDKILSLAAIEKKSGIYGSLTGHILGKIQLGGSLLIPDEINERSPAVVRVNADMDRLADKFSLHASYIKGGLTDLG
ncbi:MAG: hypothetical protein KI790_16035, partial [Cyclobacteriaceae bacterium]|nr:hypothetical protein [Cyclobacteriaceae bacterium HetDA_MAG_MS6]